MNSVAEQTYLIVQYHKAARGGGEQQSVIRAMSQLINILFAKGLVEPGKVTADSAQIHYVFEHSAPAFLAYRLFQQLMTPFHLAAGIGISEETALEALDNALEAEQLLVLFNSEVVEDALLNTVLRTWGRLKLSQTLTQQAMSFAYEVHTPIYLPYAMQPIAWPKRDLNKIQEMKQQCLDAWQEQTELPFFDFEQMASPNWQAVDDTWDHSELYVPDLMVKGYASTLSRMMGTTRQNIDYHLRHGDIGWERTLTATIVWQLTREEQARRGEIEE